MLAVPLPRQVLHSKVQYSNGRLGVAMNPSDCFVAVTPATARLPAEAPRTRQARVAAQQARGSWAADVPVEAPITDGLYRDILLGSCFLVPGCMTKAVNPSFIASARLRTGLRGSSRSGGGCGSLPRKPTPEQASGDSRKASSSGGPRNHRGV